MQHFGSYLFISNLRICICSKLLQYSVDSFGNCSLSKFHALLPNAGDKAAAFKIDGRLAKNVSATYNTEHWPGSDAGPFRRGRLLTSTPYFLSFPILLIFFYRRNRTATTLCHMVSETTLLKRHPRTRLQLHLCWLIITSIKRSTVMPLS